jgi:hypothetical protein
LSREEELKDAGKRDVKAKRREGFKALLEEYCFERR